MTKLKVDTGDMWMDGVMLVVFISFLDDPRKLISIRIRPRSINDSL